MNNDFPTCVQETHEMKATEYPATEYPAIGGAATRREFRRLSNDYSLDTGNPGVFALSALLSSFSAVPTLHLLHLPSASKYDPCPCGSGQKYKFCHGRTPKLVAAAPRVTRPESHVG